jgi:chromate transport protein ChrA
MHATKSASLHVSENDTRLRAHAGLAAVGVALVASAAVGLTAGTCRDRTTRCINAIAAVVSYYYPATYIFPALILAGGLVTLVTRRKQARSHMHACMNATTPPRPAPAACTGGLPASLPATPLYTRLLPPGNSGFQRRPGKL